MKTLLILRHAKADRPPGVADHERPLKRRGRHDAERVGTLLAERRLVPDRIVSSTAVRARETALLVAEAAGHHAAIELREELYQAAAGDVLGVLASGEREGNCVMVVGHNPTFEDLLERLIGRHERLSTAALAQVELPIEDWMLLDSRTRGQLLDLWRPKEMEE